MKRSNQCHTSAQCAFESVAKIRTPLWSFVESDRSKRGIESQPAKRHDHTHSGEQFKLAKQIRSAVRDLTRQRLVLRRRAPNSSGNVTITQAQAVVSVNRFRLIREAGLVQCSKEPVAASISSEDPSGPVTAVRRRREADDEEARSRITKTWNRFTPVLLIRESLYLFASDPLAPFDEPRAEPARDDTFV